MADYRLSATLSVNDNMTPKLRSAQKAAESLTRGVGSLKDQNLLWRVGVEGLEKIKRLQTMAKGMKFSPINITAQDNATPKVSKLKNDLRTLAGKAHNVIVNVQTNGAEKLRGIKQNLGEMANGMVMATGAGMMGIAGVGYGLVDLVNTYKDFDYQMKRNKALFTTGMSPEQAQPIYQQLVETARKYGSTMIFTNAEVGKALEYMALAGWDANTSMKALPAILNASVASGEDLAMVSDIITDDMTAMGYKAGTYVKNGMGQMVEATQHFSDVLLRTTLRSNTNFQQLGYAMKYAAPLANALGYNIEDVAIAMGLMANNGIKADQAGTALRGMLVRMAKAPKQAAEAMKHLGFDAFDQKTFESRGLMANLMDIRSKLKGKDAEKILDFVEEMTGEQIGERGEVADFLKEEMSANGGKLTDKSLAKLASQFSGTYALAGFLAMMNSTDEDIRKLMTEIYQKSDGTGAEINKEMMDTLQGDLKTIQSAWEDFQYELMNGKGADGLRSFLQAATKDINAFKTALKDGFDLGDIFGLLSNVVTQLKDKFLALDGIGSVLAGGILAAGLKKLFNMGLRVKNMLGEITRLGATTAATSTAAKASTLPAATSSVGTMNVRAGVVNLSGNIKGGSSVVGGSNVVGGAAGAGRGVGTTQPQIIAAQNRLANAQAKNDKLNAQLMAAKANRDAKWERVRIQSANGGASDKAIAAAKKADVRLADTYARLQPRIAESQARLAQAQKTVALQNSQIAAQKYYAQREAQLAAQAAPQVTPPANVVNEARAARIAGMKSAAGGGALLAGLFGAMDVASMKSMNAERLAAADTEIAELKRVHQELRDAGAGQEQLNNQVAAIRDAETARNALVKQNAADERLALSGATGSVAGTALGAAIGSLVGPLGTMLGGLAGGVIGDKIGRVAGEMGNERAAQQEADTAPKNFFATYGGKNAQPSLADFKRMEEQQAAESPPPRASMGDFRRADEAYSATAKAQAEATRAQLETFKSYDNYLATQGKTLFNRPTETATQDFYRDKATTRPAEYKPPEFQLPKFDFAGQMARTRSDQGIQAPKFETQPPIKLPELKMPEFKMPELKLSEQSTRMRSDQGIQAPKFETQPPIKIPEIKIPEFQLPEFKMPEFNFGSLIDDLFGFKRAAAAELNETQLAQQAAMERGQMPTTAPEVQKPEAPEFGLESLTSSLEGVGELFSGLGETIQTGLTSSLEGVGELFSGLGETIQTGLTSSFEGASETLAAFGTTIQEGLANAFTGVGETFAQLGTTISSGLEAARGAAESSMSAIKASFDSGIQAIQAAWGALPGFFSGIFSGLGGAAAAAGAAIASGLTSCIGSVIGAWQSAASTIQGIIASIGSAGAGLGASIGSHYKGTASFEGGFTEINEHGGELMVLPRGTKIYPHATTKEILHREIQTRLRQQESVSDSGISGLDFQMPNQIAPLKNKSPERNSTLMTAITNMKTLNPQSEMPQTQNVFGGDDFNLWTLNQPSRLDGIQTEQSSLPVPRFDLSNVQGATSNSTTNNSTSNSTSNVSLTFGDTHITNGMDFDEFVHRLRAAIANSAANSVQY